MIQLRYGEIARFLDLSYDTVEQRLKPMRTKAKVMIKEAKDQGRVVEKKQRKKKTQSSPSLHVPRQVWDEVQRLRAIEKHSRSVTSESTDSEFQEQFGCTRELPALDCINPNLLCKSIHVLPCN